LPMRRGEPVFDAFAALADPLLEDTEFFVRKAIGWVLRERTKTAPEEVHAWLMPRRRRASRLTLREASKNLPEPMRAELLGD
ncbi:MAG TPA: DNA alkylation repair protein, partial [Trueperaceae bacterium]|nr:DNA alkylation repair protein [Trueperaceae bacterium]